MGKSSKMSARELAAKVSPSLKRKLGARILLSHLQRRDITPMEALREAAMTVAIEARDRDERKEAKDILYQLGYECDRSDFETAISLTHKMLEMLTDLTVLDPIGLGTHEMLIDATALLFAIDDVNSSERSVGRSILSSRSHADTVKTFRALAELEILGADDTMEAFLRMQLEVSKSKPALKPARAPKPKRRTPPPRPSPRPETAEGVAETLRSPPFNPVNASPVEVGSPAASEVQVRDKDSSPRKRPRKPSPRRTRRNARGPVSWSEREEVPETISAIELRAIDLRNKRMSEPVMCKLICVYCFGTGHKPPAHTNLREVRANMERMLQHDKPALALFKRCWKRMSQRGAIQVQKGGDVASLPSDTSEISDPKMRGVLEWTLIQNRRLAS